MTHYLVKRARGRIQLSRGEDPSDSDPDDSQPKDGAEDPVPAAPPKRRSKPKTAPRKARASAETAMLGRRVYERCKANASDGKGVHLSPTDLSLLLGYIQDLR